MISNTSWRLGVTVGEEGSSPLSCFRICDKICEELCISNQTRHLQCVRPSTCYPRVSVREQFYGLRARGGFSGRLGCAGESSAFAISFSLCSLRGCGCVPDFGGRMATMSVHRLTRIVSSCRKVCSALCDRWAQGRRNGADWLRKGRTDGAIGRPWLKDAMDSK